MSNLQVNLFTYGDAHDINTWSNVPYFFHRALLGRGARVTPIDVMPSDSVLFQSLRRWRRFRSRVASDCFRTQLNFDLTNRKVHAASSAHAAADLNVFLTFSFSSHRYSRTPVVLYCDRTFEHYLADCGRTPTMEDCAYIAMERENLERADLVLAMSEMCRDFIRSRYTTRRLAYLEAGINAESATVDPHELIARKERHHDILFIGRGAHKRGADILVRAFRMFNDRQRGRFVLHVIGVRPQELPVELQAARDDIRFYGYLDRNVASQRDLYDSLLQSARLFVFPTRPAPIAAVLREAKLNCTPVLITRVPGAAERVTHDHDGVLVGSLEPADFARQMEALITDVPRWRRLACNAHRSVEHSTWSNTAANFLTLVERNGLVPRASARLSISPSVA